MLRYRENLNEVLKGECPEEKLDKCQTRTIVWRAAELRTDGEGPFSARLQRAGPSTRGRVVG